tara:strand:+ start:190 stop:297 length:108 start_codon:yes stop_codon:yes gene_type:complete
MHDIAFIFFALGFVGLFGVLIALVVEIIRAIEKEP